MKTIFMFWLEQSKSWTTSEVASDSWSGGLRFVSYSWFSGASASVCWFGSSFRSENFHGEMEGIIELVPSDVEGSIKKGETELLSPLSTNFLNY